jgi:hypothetical protein
MNYKVYLYICQCICLFNLNILVEVSKVEGLSNVLIAASNVVLGKKFYKKF